MRFYVVLVFSRPFWRVSMLKQHLINARLAVGEWYEKSSLVLLSASAARKQRQELGKTSSHDVEDHEANGHGDDDRKQDE